MRIPLAAARLPFLSCLLSLPVFISSCSKEEATQETVKPIEIAVAKVAKRDVPINFEFVGQTKGAIDAPVRARVEGVLLSIEFQEGKEVKEGQLLYTIDPAPFNAKLAESQGKLAEATTRLAKAESDLKRMETLVKINAVSRRDYDTAVAQEGAAKGAVDAAKAVNEAAKIDLSYTKILAPTSGVIGLSAAKVGEFVGKPPNPVVLNTVSKLDPIHVRFAITEKEYLFFAKLKKSLEGKGQEPQKKVLTMQLADGSEFDQKGEVDSIDREIDAQTGSMAVEAAFPNPDKMVRPGQFARIKTVGDTIKDALLIQKTALRELQGQYQVFVVKSDNTVESRNVKVGSEVDNMQVIESGLADNEVVAIEGLQRLKSGMPILPKMG